MNERTLVLIKPDAVRRGLAGQILERFITSGFTVVVINNRIPTRELVEAHYGPLFQNRPDLRKKVADYLVSGPIVAAILERENAILRAREIVGPLVNPWPGTIRHDFGADRLHSLVHASDSPETAEYEIDVWFSSPSDRRRKERERLFIQAITCQRKGDTSGAKQYAQQCLERLKIEADNAPIEDVASTTIGSGFPGLLHTQTALREFRAAGIEI